MKRIAIPILDSKLSEYFGKCSHYEIFDISNDAILKSQLELPDIHHVSQLPAWASKKGITDIITYKIDRKIIMLFNKYKINLYVGIDIDSPDKLLEEFLNEHLISNQKIITEIFNDN